MIRASLALFFAVIASARAADEGVYNQPVYDPASKSYYALIDGRQRMTKYHPGYVWSEAQAEAPSRLWHGVKGRLATIPSIATYEFLLTTFHVGTDTWIGYRYMCEAQQILDSSGRIVPKGAFTAWDNPWKQDPFACAINQYTHDYQTHDLSSAQAYAPIAIHPVEQGFRWFAKGPDKGYNAYLIEWPTGGP